MLFPIKSFFFQFIPFLLLQLPTNAFIHRHNFVLTETPYTRLCTTKNLLTVNGKFPGPTLYANQGDTIIVNVINKASENITIHWHGVKQPRNPWSDGPEYVTQCPIRPGKSFRQKIILSEEIGTLWWHAHSEWSRVTVHGALIVYPKKKNDYPFPVPHAEIPIILGEWWNADIKVLNKLITRKIYPNVSDAFLINGQPGDLYPCSTSSDTFKLTVESGKTYLIRMVNAVMNNIKFFKIANHNMTVVGTDGSYTKPLNSDYIAISPGQTIDFLFKANQQPSHYYMASRVYDVIPGAYDNTTTTAIVEYRGNYTPPSSPLLPTFPEFNDTVASAIFTGKLRSLASKDHPVDVPLDVTENLFITLSMNTIPCPYSSCKGPFGEQLFTSLNNITFEAPKVDILQAYYNNISGVYGDDFPSYPTLPYNYTADIIPQTLWRPRYGTEVKVLEYSSVVEIVLQGTNIVTGVDHPMHLHGYSFYVVGWGFGNFDKEKDPLNYNLVDPLLLSTINVPRNAWVAIRFKANNPGVWLFHCHFEIHVSWGMEMAFIVKNGKTRNSKMLPPPRDMPRC